MAIKMYVDPSRQLTIFTGIGEITFDDIARSINTFYAESPTLNVLFDISRASVKTISANQIAQIAERLPKLRMARKRGRTAIVAATDLSYGLARMFETMTAVSFKFHLVETRVFRDIKVAMDWLSRNR